MSYTDLCLDGVTMPAKETDAHKKWVKENTVFIGVRLQKNTDAEIIDFLQEKQNNNGTIKQALKLLIEQEKKGSKTMKAIVIKGIGMPEEKGMLDVRIYGDGTVFVPCTMGEGSDYSAEEIDLPEEK